MVIINGIVLILFMIAFLIIIIGAFIDCIREEMYTVAVSLFFAALACVGLVVLIIMRMGAV